MVHARVALVAVSLLLLACSTDPDDGCTAMTEVSVSGGLTPTFDWSPRCRVNSLSVSVAVSGTAPPSSPFGGVITGDRMWAVQAENAEENAILPSVRYGVVPGDARAIDELQPLEEGTEYVVLLGAVEPGRPGSFVGFLKFTP